MFYFYTVDPNEYDAPEEGIAPKEYIPTEQRHRREIFRPGAGILLPISGGTERTHKKQIF